MTAKATVLSRRELNRAVLARQMLLEQRRMTVGSALEHLVGMQAQAPNLPYVGLWSRLEGFRHEELSRLIERKLAVRMSLMRATIHLVTTRDALRMRPLLHPVTDRGMFAGSPWMRQVKGVDLDRLLAEAREIMGERPRTIAELARVLGSRFPAYEGLALAYTVRGLLPMVFVPPRGIWGAHGPVALTTVDAWLGRPLGPALDPERFALRYLAAFGPASATDMRAWSGIAARQTFEHLRPRLRVFRDESGVELFDLPDAPRPSGDTPAPARYLPDYDNILQGHADRSRIMAPGQHLGLFSSNGVMKGSVLVDGFVAGSWIPTKEKGTTALTVTPFERVIPRAERAAVAGEGMRLLKLLAPGDSHDVRFARVKP
ncbi:MAG: winged helix DNA-binding domain-containing protein [Candidatus Dormibacterales bacterium]